MTDNRKMQAEYERIVWRQKLLNTPQGVEFLTRLARTKEKDVGPNQQAAFNAFLAQV